MWQHVSFTLSTALQTFDRLHKSWAKFGISYAVIFLILGFFIGFCVLVALGFLLRSSWANMEDTQQYIFIWIEHAIKLGLRILISSTGLLGFYLYKNANDPEAGRQPFEKFSRSIPRAAWQLFLLMSIIQSVIYYIHLHGSMRSISSYEDIPNDFGIENRRLYLNWFYGTVEIVGALVPYLIAGLLYLKAAGLKQIALYKKEFLNLLIVGYAFSSLIATVTYLIYKIVLSLIVIPLNQNTMAMLLMDFVYTFLHVTATMIFGYIVYSAFQQEEIVLEEAAN